jgi:hypothetical protein
MAITDTFAIEPGTARSSYQQTFIAPVPITVDHDEILIKDGATSLPFEATDTTRTLHANGTPCRLVEFNVDGSDGSLTADTLEYHDAAQTQETIDATINPNITEKFDAGGQVRVLVKYNMDRNGPHQALLGGGNTKSKGYEMVDITLPRNRYFHRKTDYRVTVLDTYVLESGMEMLVVKDYRANENQVDFAMTIHNAGIDENLSDDVEFVWMKVLTKPGIEIEGAEWDGCTDLDNGFIVASTDSNQGTHVMPQRGLRTVYFHAVLAGATAIKSFAGQHGCPEAFHDYPCGIAGSRLPLLTDVAATRTFLEDDYDDNKTSFLTKAIQFNGHAPVSYFWCGTLNHGGDKTGGDEVLWNKGLAATCAPSWKTWEMLRIQHTRYACRQATSIFKDGYPFRASDYLENGVAPWRHFAGNFQKGNWQPGGPPIEDGPFDFHKVNSRRRHSQQPVKNINWDNGGQFFNIDEPHWPRTWKETLGLAWYANDPTAWMHIQMNAQLAMMTYPAWDGGLSDRFKAPSGDPGLGMDHGRGVAWSGFMIAHANAQLTPWPADPYFETWMDRYVDLCEHNQMPSGLLSANRSNKEATQIPFGDGSTAYFWVYRNTQQVKLGLLLWACRNLRTTANSDHARIDAVLLSLCSGLDTFSQSRTAAGEYVGIQSKYCAGPFPSTYRYSNYSEIGPGHNGEDIQAWLEERTNSNSNSIHQFSGWMAIPFELSYSGRVAQLERLCDERGNGAAACETEMETWDKFIPGSTDTRLSIWGHTLGSVQKANTP